jgi:hypothetical protein
VSPPPGGALWRPVDDLAELRVVTVARDGQPRVELVDARTWVELVTLTPGAAAAVAVVLTERARRAGWVHPDPGPGPDHEPGS